MVNLKLVQKNQSEDVVLEPNDIVEVPGGTGAPAGGIKGIFDGIVKSVVPGLSMLPIQVIR